MKSITLANDEIIKITNIPEKGKYVPSNIRNVDAVTEADRGEQASYLFRGRIHQLPDSSTFFESNFVSRIPSQF